MVSCRCSHDQTNPLILECVPDEYLDSGPDFATFKSNMVLGPHRAPESTFVDVRRPLAVLGAPPSVDFDWDRVGPSHKALGAHAGAQRAPRARLLARLDAPSIEDGGGHAGSKVGVLEGNGLDVWSLQEWIAEDSSMK